MTRRRTQGGFTLIEIMISVAIIGILAAIAIPNYVRYQLRAKRTEVYLMMSMMRTQQTAYWADYDCFASTDQNPIGLPLGRTRAWSRATTAATPCTGVPISTELFGLIPANLNVYYSYRCFASPPGAGVGDYTCAAQGDLDDDGNLAEYMYCTDHALTGTGLASPFGAPCTITFEQVRASIAIF